MRKVFIIIFSVILISSCKSAVEVPQDIMSKVEMESVMVDLIKADEIVNQQSYGDSAAGVKNKREILYQKVFQIHKVTKEQFRKSFVFYQNHPDLLKVVLDSMYNDVKRETDDTTSVKKPNTAFKEQVLKRIRSKKETQ